MAAKPSKFSSIFVTPQDPEPEKTVEETAVPEVAPDAATAIVPAAEKPSPAMEPATPQTATRTTTGKKSDPRYKQVTAYVRKDLHRNVTDALYDETRGRDDAKRKEFSELVDELLERWLQGQRGNGRREHGG